MSGTDIRAQVNLKDNPGNLGKVLKIQGSLEAYFRQPGIKAPTAFELSGTTGGDTPDTPTPGAGTETSPYDVAQVIALNPTSTSESPENGKDIFVKGYIVGSMPASGTYLDKTNFDLTDASTTNIVLGPTADCKDYTKCIGIQLPKGAVRDALNLSQNSTNLGKQVILRGDVMMYCKGPGLKNTSSYSFVE